ncbi:MAG TPA: hypothetical protein VFF02_09445 [Anaeromyxobacteraceae bacterium]|nr:hypothetical protein [Anaeromyxobacteraceae bacterium]
MRTRFAALALCAVVAVPARAGVTLTREGKGGRTAISIDGNKARVDNDGRDGRTASIFDGDRRTLLILDHVEQSYAEKVERGAVPAERFRPPPAYRKTQIPR